MKYRAPVGFSPPHPLHEPNGEVRLISPKFQPLRKRMLLLHTPYKSSKFESSLEFIFRLDLRGVIRPLLSSIDEIPVPPR